LYVIRIFLVTGGVVVDGYDVAVVGAGNAAFSAALAARERVERVLVLEKAPREWVGGSRYFTAGAFRTTFESLEELRPLLDEVSKEELARTEAPPYTKEYLMADMKRLTQGRCDEKLTSVEGAQANTPVNDELTLRQHSKIEPPCHKG
jgi:glycine/D-amino acid oxidase-like deaminating enzyme